LWHVVPSGCRWRRWPPAMEGSCANIYKMLHRALDLDGFFGRT